MSTPLPKPYIIRGNNQCYDPCILKIEYGNRYVVAKFKLQSAGLKRIEDSLNSFIRGGKNNPEGLYHHLFNYVRRQPDHAFKVTTLLVSTNAYELLKLEQQLIDAGAKDPNFLNNQAQAYIPTFNEVTEMYGNWIPKVAVMSFRKWFKTRKKARPSKSSS